MAAWLASRSQQHGLSRCLRWHQPPLPLAASPASRVLPCSTCGAHHTKSGSTQADSAWAHCFSRRRTDQSWSRWRMLHNGYTGRDELTRGTTSDLQHSPYTSTQSVTAKEEVSLGNIFSDINRQRVTERINTVRSVRPTTTRMGANKKRKVSAVLVPLCVVDEEPSVLFTLRSSSLRKHRGEVSFPGGNQDDSDLDHTHTALRETFEEIGLIPRHFEVWGTLFPSATRSENITYPVLARYKPPLEPASLLLNTEEVQEVFTVPVAQLCDLDQLGSTQFRTGAGCTLPLYLSGSHRIWGLTAIILHQVLTLVAPGLYTYRIRHVA